MAHSQVISVIIYLRVFQIDCVSYGNSKNINIQ